MKHKSLAQKATINDKKEGNVVNSGSLSGADIAISSGELVNTSTGIINNAIIINDGESSNEGFCGEGDAKRRHVQEHRYG